MSRTMILAFALLVCGGCSLLLGPHQIVVDQDADADHDESIDADADRDADADGDRDVDADAEIDSGGDADVEADLDADLDEDEDLEPPLLATCADLRDADWPSGWYDIDGSGVVQTVYCDMDHEGGGWTQIADFDAAEDPCPPAWEHLDDPVVCHSFTRPSEGAEVRYASRQGPYSEVRGYVRGYQWESTDAFNTGGDDVDSTYVDGVSITRGADPREYVWTYASGLQRGADPAVGGACPCEGGAAPPGFVGPSYYCDSANPTDDWYTGWFDEPLWDENGTDGECENTPDPAWFVVDLFASSDEPIGVRIMFDHGDDDIGISELVLFVR